jgi:hypothetical protein
MAKGLNTVESEVLRVTVSAQSARLLDDLAAKGIYGRNPAEVAARFIDEALQRFVDTPRLSLNATQAQRRKP